MYLKQIKQFYSIFPNGTICKPALNSLIITNQLQSLKIHTAIWKIYLLILSKTDCASITQENWIPLIKELREKFKEIREKYQITENFDGTPDSMGPLISIEGSKWCQYYKDNELKRQITRDIERLYFDQSFFESKENLEVIEEIIFLHLRNFPEIEYNQGFHEVCAIVYYYLCKEMKTTKERIEKAEIEDTSAFDLLFSEDDVIADTFWVYSEIIDYIYKFYSVSSNVSFISDNCCEILLHDMVLYNKSIAPMLDVDGLYTLMYPWFRIMFARIFPLDQIGELWSFIFLHRPDLKIFNFISISLILSMEEQILGCENKFEVLSVFKKAKSDNVKRIIKTAIEIQKQKSNSNEDEEKNEDENETQKLIQKCIKQHEENILLRKDIFEPICKDAETILPSICAEPKESVLDHLKKLRDAFLVVKFMTCQKSQDEIELFKEEPKQENECDASEDGNVANDADSNNIIANDDIINDNNNIENLPSILETLPKATSGKLAEVKADTSLLTEENEEFHSEPSVLLKPKDPKNLFE